MIIDLFNSIYVKRAIIFLLRYNDPSDAPVGLFPHHLLRRKEMVLLFISVFPPPPNLTRLLDIHRATCPRSKSLTHRPFTVLPNTCKEIGETEYANAYMVRVRIPFITFIKDSLWCPLPVLSQVREKSGMVEIFSKEISSIDSSLNHCISFYIYKRYW